MTNKPKTIGTRGETAINTMLRKAGLESRRVTLAGNYDQGDIHLSTETVVAKDGGYAVSKRLSVIEVKSGKAAQEASHGQVDKWLAELVTEVGNARKAGLPVEDAKHFLVVQRRGIGVGRPHLWDAYAVKAGIAHTPVRLWAGEIPRVADPAHLGWVPGSIMDDLELPAYRAACWKLLKEGNRDDSQ